MLNVDYLDSFVNLKDKTEKIIPIIKEYDFTSIIRVIFSITSWRNNRGAQESCLALNNALCLIDDWGSKKINTHAELSSLFDEIYPILKIAMYDDPVLMDCGEVKLCYKNRYYSVITGTGHTAPIFADLQFLECASEIASMDTYTESILHYSDTMLSYLLPSNHHIDSNFSMSPKFECPSTEYFNSVDSFFATKLWENLPGSLLNILSTNNNHILKSHFVLYDEEFYPIYNPSLIVDYFTNIVGTLPNTRIEQVVKQSLTRKINMLYCSHMNHSPKLIANCLLLDEQTPIEFDPTIFAFIKDEHLIIFLNVADNNQHLSVISQIEGAFSKAELSIVDLDQRTEKNYCQAYRMAADGKLHFILFDNHINVDETSFRLTGRTERRIYSAIDLMYAIMFSENILGLIEFDDKSRTESAQILSYGGASDYYTIYSQEKGFISKGAIEFSNIYSEIDTSAANIFTKYLELNKCFPFHLSPQTFSQPECWNIVKDDNGLYQYSKKSSKLIAGAVFLFDNGLTVFLSYDFLSILKDDASEQTKINLESFRGIVEHFLVEYHSLFSSTDCLTNNYIHLCCHSLSNDVENGYIKINNTSHSNNVIKIDFIIDSQKLMMDISTVQNRAIEYQMINQIFSPILCIYPYQLSNVYETIKKDVVKNKTIDTKVIRFDFYYNTSFSSITESEVSKLTVRKHIAKIVFDSGIRPGTYEQRQATQIVRKMQSTIVNCLENKILQFNRSELHKQLLSAYSSELFSARINQESFNLGEKLEDQEKKNSQQKSFYSLMLSKSNQLALLYLIETNLYLLDNRGNTDIDDAGLAELLSFALCIVELQNNSDLCFHTDSKTRLVILDDYRVDVELGNDYSIKQENLNRRRLSSKSYETRDNGKDVEHFEKVANAFLIDTGVDFRVLMAVLEQLSVIGYELQKIGGKEIAPNVLKISTQSVLDHYSTYVLEQTPTDAIKAAYDFITISPSKLKTLNGQTHPYLPIWDREKRDNAFFIKPLVLDNDNYIFSPILIDELRNRWIHGLLQFYPPYEIGLTNVKNELVTWKKVYEELFSSDVAALFEELGFEYYKHDVDIRREDRNENHPTIDEIGDYDVIGLCKALKTIFIIECKVLQPIGSVFEHSNEQKRFFTEERFDEKFQKRIDHLSATYIDYFRNNGYEYVDEEYTIKPFMVVNKVFDSFYKPVSFPIVTYDELKTEIKKQLVD